MNQASIACNQMWDHNSPEIKHKIDIIRLKILFSIAEDILKFSQKESTIKMPVDDNGIMEKEARTQRRELEGVNEEDAGKQ